MNIRREVLVRGDKDFLEWLAHSKDSEIRRLSKIILRIVEVLERDGLK